MRESLLPYLWCPDCHADLRLDEPVWSGKTIAAGHIACVACAARFPITEGVPDFVAVDDASHVQQTTEGFADNWKHYNRVILSHEELNRDLFADWIWPLQPTAFEDKVVVEAGCGMGRWLRLAAEHRPRVLIGFDYSTVAFTAAKNVAHLENVHVVRADIYRLPIRPIAQVLYSIGVVHHTPDPARAFACLQDIVADDGVISTWVYGKENNGWITSIVDPIRKNVTSRLPPTALQLLSNIAALELRVAGEVYAAVGAPRFLPYREYLMHLREYPLGYMTHIVYDHLVPSLAHYIAHDEMVRWADGLAFVLSPRNANSWRLLAGRRRAALLDAMAPLAIDRLGPSVTVSGPSVG